MSRFPGLPDGFATVGDGPAVLLAAAPRLSTFSRAGLLDPRRWEDLLRAAGPRSGRGRTAPLSLDGGDVRLKQLRRGGLAGRLWHERFLGADRLVNNLRLPLEAVRRGLPTPLAPALLLLEGPRGLYRGWLAVDELADAVDLARRFVSGSSPRADELARALAVVRCMHDAGVEHRDLNLGNQLTRRRGDGAWDAFVVDLDRARLHPAPLRFALRQRALRRLERSWVKIVPAAAADDAGRDRLYTAYAAGDEQLGRRLARGRTAGRWWIRIHRLGWRRGSARSLPRS